MKYSNEYVEALEKLARDMAGALEEAVSIIDDSRIALVNPKKAEKSVNEALDRYYLVNRDYSND